MALAHSTYTRGGNGCGCVARYSPRALFCGCGDRVTNQIEARIMILLSDVFKPNRTVGWYL